MPPRLVPVRRESAPEEAAATVPERPRRLRTPLITLLLVALLPVSIGLSTAFGAESFPPARVAEVLLSRFTGAVPPDFVYDTIVWNLRLPRALLAVVVGAGLALAGAAMQTLVRNPLADPYLLGVSSGAGVGATAVITTGLFAGAGIWALSAGALAGALCSSLLVFTIALAQGGLTPLRLVLIGTVLGSAFSSIASFLVFRSADPAAAQSVLFWLLGSLAGAEWTQLALPAVVVVLAGSALLAGSGWLDALATGPDTAAALGVPVRGLRIALFGILTVLVGVLVAVSGGIGFVGLIVPHVARLIVGARHRALLPVAALSGAVFLLWVDVATRVLVRPTEIPLSVVSGLIGAPVFLILLGRRRYSYGGAS